MTEQEIENLKNFAKDIILHSWGHLKVSGYIVDELALKYGLVKDGHCAQHILMELAEHLK